jgi:hypothetical protein
MRQTRFVVLVAKFVETPLLFSRKSASCASAPQLPGLFAIATLAALRLSVGGDSELRPALAVGLTWDSKSVIATKKERFGAKRP